MPAAGRARPRAVMLIVYDAEPQRRAADRPSTNDVRFGGGLGSGHPYSRDLHSTGIGTYP